MILSFNVIVNLIVCGISIQTCAQKIDEPRPACSSLNKCNCEFVCKTYPTNADENFRLNDKELVELQCKDGLTSTGYDALGMDLSICLSCIRSSKPGAKTSSQLIYWSNICDLAWRTSTSSAVDALGNTYDRPAAGQVSCTNGTITSRDDLSASFLFRRATIPTHPHTAHVAADDNNTPHTQTRATHATVQQEDAGTGTGGNAQTFSQSQNRGLTTQEPNGTASLTSVVNAGQASRTATQAAATTSKKARKKKTKKCKNGSLKAIDVTLSKSVTGLSAIFVGILVSCAGI
ncbi:hypothetical protein I302_106463 [Kwoniella bestiolae CBS 10118]|uniref:Uncharacterized protein n=1 Tax=Kwoniella bestiolae CBS 10118 TaxID=1296100 RepID=A0A1B9G1C4_9TREE|nr:hypothetical protein I302_06280 [Kwoniella bestiolae CBS 10118]OCF24819.1 hypothetical protein I302_06280 [Kwoniella bestiolae CBS 10118]